MSVKIYTDSTCDITGDWCKEHDVTMLPLTYLIEEEEFEDSVEEEKILAFYDKVKNGAMPKTAAVNTERFIKAWTPELEAGNDIFFAGLPAVLSATSSNAMTAAKTLKEQFPDRQIVAVDSLTAASGLTDLILRACQWRKEGLSAQEIGKKAEEASHHYEGWVCVDDLQHLKRGGRLSATSAMMGTILNIKPMILLDHEGKLTVQGKVKGTKKAIKFFVDKVRENAADPVNGTVWISYGLSEDLANSVEQAIREEVGTKDVRKKRIGGVVGTHTGPYMVAIFFQSK